MTLYNRVRTPGPSGIVRDLNPPPIVLSPGVHPRIPGPLGTGGTLFVGEDGVTPVPQQSQPTVSTVNLVEPDPVFRDDVKLREVLLPLFASDPQPGDVIQGGIANCPLAAVLVAAAHVNPQQIKGMISETTADVNSTSKSDSKFKKKTTKLLTVKFLKGKPVEISRLLYHDDEGDLVYAHSPNGVSWVSFIEKGYAVLRGRNSYNGLNERTQLREPPSANQVMEDVVGSPDVILLDGAKVDDKRLRTLLKNANTHATIAASRNTSSEFGKITIVAHHGYAILAFKDKKNDKDAEVQLRNPWGGAGADITLSLKDFKAAFAAVLQATP
ncbi:MAG: C2 family cysteine protease [Candidatus Binatia bacterium]